MIEYNYYYVPNLFNRQSDFSRKKFYVSVYISMPGDGHLQKKMLEMLYDFFYIKYLQSVLPKLK